MMIRSSLLGLAATLAIASPGRAGFVNVDLTPYANDSLATIDPAYPTGSLTLGGVPFVIPATGNNIWTAAGLGAGTHSIDIKVNVANAAQVETLINTSWGQAGPTSYASIEFKGTGGADLVTNLIGNADIRDYNNDGWTNSINGTSTVNVVSLEGGQHRLDLQTFNLGGAFAGQTLTDIILTDTGADNFQRVFLSGATVVTNAVPEPSSLALMGIGVAGTVAAARRGRRR